LVGIGVESEVLHRADARLFEPQRDEARQVEHRMARSLGGLEEFLERSVGFAETRDEFRSHFITWLADQRADGVRNIYASRAEVFQLRDGGFHDAIESASLTGMSGVYPARLSL